MSRHTVPSSATATGMPSTSSRPGSRSGSSGGTTWARGSRTRNHSCTRCAFGVLRTRQSRAPKVWASRSATSTQSCSRWPGSIRTVTWSIHRLHRIADQRRDVVGAVAFLGQADGVHRRRPPPPVHPRGAPPRPHPDRDVPLKRGRPAPPPHHQPADQAAEHARAVGRGGPAASRPRTRPSARWRSWRRVSGRSAAAAGSAGGPARARGPPTATPGPPAGRSRRARSSRPPDMPGITAP